MNKTLTIACFFAFLASSAQADSPYLLENAMELTAKQVSFTLSGAGSMTVRTCANCRPETFRFTPTTEFSVGKERVNRARFVELSRSGGEIYAFYDTSSGYVTRLKLRSPLRNTSQARR